MLEASKRIDTALEKSMGDIRNQLREAEEKLVDERKVAQLASAQGDRSENAEWQIAMDNIARLNTTIMDLNSKIDAYTSYTGGYVPSGVVAIGSTVRIYDTEYKEELIIKLVPEGLGDAKIGAIAITTPVGVALCGKSASETVTVKAPIGNLNFIIKEVY